MQYYDYLGLMMGFVALFEGLLTLLVAMVVYFILRQSGRLRELEKL